MSEARLACGASLTREPRPPCGEPRDRDRTRGHRDAAHEGLRGWWAWWVRWVWGVCGVREGACARERERAGGGARAGALRGGPLLVKLVGVEVFGRVVRVVHTWRLGGGRGGVVVAGRVARAAAAVRRALVFPTTDDRLQVSDIVRGRVGLSLRRARSARDAQ